MAYFDRFVAFTTMSDDIGKFIHKIKTARMEAFGLQSTDALCLAVLSRREEGLSLTALAVACRLDKAAVSRAVHRLQKGGFVRYREADVKKAYRAPLVLTEAGQAAVAAIREYADDAVRHASAGIPPEQIEAMYATLDRIRDNLARYVKELEENGENG